MLKEMYPLLYSLFLNSVSLWKRAISGHVVTVVENVWINAAYKGSIHILYLDLVSLQVVQLPIDFLGALMLNKKLNMVFFVFFFCFFFPVLYSPNTPWTLQKYSQ